MVLEAKGSNKPQRLGRLSRNQMNHNWIDTRLERLIAANVGRSDAVKLRDAIRRNRPIVASVVSLNIRAQMIRFGAQFHQDQQTDGGNVNQFQPWKGSR